MITMADWKVTRKQKKFIKQVLKSGRLTYGDKTRELERRFAEIHDVTHALFTSSGTAALKIALHALKDKHGWKDGDEVIIPAVTFVATMNVVLMNKLKPVLVDVKLDTANIDPELIEKAITKKTRAIIPVHLLGQPAEMDAIMKIVKKHKLKVVEDSCFVANTLIPTKSGTKKIRDIKAGDKLLGFDEKTKSFKETIVMDTSNRLVNYEKLLVIKFANGQTVRCTEEHPFYIKGKWITAGELKIGDEAWHSSWGEYTSWRRDYKLSDKGRAIVSENMRKNNPSFNHETIRKGATNRRHIQTRIESRVAQTAKDFDLPLEYVGDGQLWIGSKTDGFKNPDFVVTGEKKVIEVFDPTFQYRHSGGVIKRDKVWREKRSNFFKQFGYETKFLELSGWVGKKARETLAIELREFVSNGIEIVSIKKASKGFLKRYNNGIDESGDMARVYNLHCEPYNNFVLTSGILVHNCETMFVNKVKGDIACFSSYIAHLLVTGIGGLITTNDDELAVVMRSMMFHGRDESYLNMDDKPMDISKRFWFPRFGYSDRMTELEAALGLGEIDGWSKMIKKRQDNAQYLIDNLQGMYNYGITTFNFPVTDVNNHAFMFFPLLVDRRDDLMLFLEKRGIQTRTMMPLTNQPVAKPYVKKKYPVAQYINDYGLLLGCHQYLKRKDLGYMVESIKRFYYA